MNEKSDSKGHCQPNRKVRSITGAQLICVYYMTALLFGGLRHVIKIIIEIMFTLTEMKSHSSCKHVREMNSPLHPTFFFIVKLGFTGVFIFLFLL